MTREQKIKSFFEYARSYRSLRWCESVCACMGCINGTERKAWSLRHPEEPRITKAEFQMYTQPNN